MLKKYKHWAPSDIQHNQLERDHSLKIRDFPLTTFCLSHFTGLPSCQ